MNKNLLLTLAVIFSVILFFLIKYLLQRMTVNNSVFFASLTSVIGFCIFLLFGFLYLESNAFDPSYSYSPPSIIDGKVKDGSFSK